MPILQWVNDGDARREAKNVPFHLLERIKTYGTPNESGESENLLVHGDNLIALRALLPFYRGKVKCIYIDPPYNTGSAFEHYDDNLEHSKWLSLIYPRLQLLREFLSEDGSIWVSIDDRECHYLKVIMDEIFGRDKFLADIAWQRTYSMRNDSDGIPTEAENLLVYKKSEAWRPGRLPRTEEMNSKYTNPDNDPLGNWQNTSAFAPNAATHQGMVYAIQHPFSGKMIYPTASACWRYQQEQMLEYMNGWCPYKLEDLHDEAERAKVCGINAAEVRKEVKAIVLAEPFEIATHKAQTILEKGPWPRFFFTKNGKGGIRRKTYLSSVPGKIASNLWPFSETGHTDEAKKEILALFGPKVFDTPKPERLIARILTVATTPGDLVLDSFLGSGTTAAVAHKMGRRWIGIEMGDHAKTHCIPRLEKVIAGEQGGISESIHWQGGGSFTFCELGEPVFDTWGNINPKVTFETLSAYLWQKETRTTTVPQKAPFLGAANGVGIYLLYNGILGDKAPASGNVLTRKLMKSLLADYPYEGPKIIYADAVVSITPRELEAAQITFKQIPYDIRG